MIDYKRTRKAKLINDNINLISEYMAHIQLLPKWIMKRYLVLWKALDEKDFTFDDALSILGKLSKPDSRKLVALLLSELRKAGWLLVDFNPSDARRRVYRLRPYHAIFEQVVEQSYQVKE